MLDGAFTFRGRIGRLRFFGNGLLMGPAAAVLAVALAMSFPRDGDATRRAAFFGLAALAGVGFLWFSLSLHVRRIRDIGWDPVAVVGGWLVGNVADPVLAALVPRLALHDGQHGGTAFGIALNLGLSLALLFWPGRDGSDDVPASRAPAPPRPTSSSPASPRPAAPSLPPARGRAKGFGRRGVA